MVPVAAVPVVAAVAKETLNMVPVAAVPVVALQNQQNNRQIFRLPLCENS